MKDFRKLEVWERSHHLALAIYRETKEFPKDELYGLTSQLRRASTSIPANIAEGYGRGSDAELARFLRFSMGSANELEYHLLLAHDLQLLEHAIYTKLDQDLAVVKRQLTSFYQRLTARGQ